MRTREGFALPLAVLVIAVLTASVVAAFSRVDAERQVNENQDAQLTAFSYAESGLQNFMTNRATLGFVALPPAVSESTRVAMAGGYADVVLSQLRAPAPGIAGLYVIRSHAVVSGGAMRPTAEHTVAQFATFQATTMNVLSGWTSLTGLHKNGGSGTLGGADNCGAATAVAGVAVPNSPGYTQSGGSSVPDGTPPISNLGTQAQAAAAVKIDWDGIVNHNAIQADITIPGGSWPSFSNPAYWPVIMVIGDFSLPGDGQGTLIVTGDLTISGNKHWDGVVLVGDNITSNGNNGVYGATISGLNIKLGIAVPNGDVGNGNKDYEYDSCAVANATSRFASLQPIPNAWMNNWASY